jgi:hypothetical protein
MFSKQVATRNQPVSERRGESPEDLSFFVAEFLDGKLTKKALLCALLERPLNSVNVL